MTELSQVKRKTHPANDDLMPLDGGETLHDQLLCWFLLVKGDKAEVLRGVVLRLVNWADDFDYRSKLVGKSISII